MFVFYKKKKVTLPEAEVKPIEVQSSMLSVPIPANKAGTSLGNEMINSEDYIDEQFIRSLMTFDKASAVDSSMFDVAAYRRYLSRKDANVNAIPNWLFGANPKGWALVQRFTLLHHATREGNGEKILLLLERGASINVQTIHKNTPAQLYRERVNVPRRMYYNQQHLRGGQKNESGSLSNPNWFDQVAVRMVIERKLLAVCSISHSRLGRNTEAYLRTVPDVIWVKILVEMFCGSSLKQN